MIFPKDRKEKRSESLFANTRVARAAAGHVLRVRQSTENYASSWFDSLARDIALLAI